MEPIGETFHDMHLLAVPVGRFSSQIGARLEGVHGPVHPDVRASADLLSGVEDLWRRGLRQFPAYVLYTPESAVAPQIDPWQQDGLRLLADEGADGISPGRVGRYDEVARLFGTDSWPSAVARAIILGQLEVEPIAGAAALTGANVRRAAQLALGLPDRNGQRAMGQLQRALNVTSGMQAVVRAVQVGALVVGPRYGPAEAGIFHDIPGVLRSSQPMSLQ